MPHDRPSVARGRCRPVRLVRGLPGPRRRYSPIGADAASAYENGLAKVRYLRDLFPEFYQKHIADRVLTPSALLASVCAFLALVHRDLFELEDSMNLEVPLDPLKALRYTETGDDDPLLVIEESSFWLSQPHPLYYGIGMQTVLEDETPQAALTLALWHLCRETNWSSGVDVLAVAEFSYVPPHIMAVIEKLPPLPAGTMMEDLILRIQLPGRPWSSELAELICYPFARCDNAMLNVTNYEIDVLYGGETDDDWSQARAIAENAKDALRLSGLYGQWSHAVEQAPGKELRALAKALHAAASAPPPQPKTLIELLAPETEEVTI